LSGTLQIIYIFRGELFMHLSRRCLVLILSSLFAVVAQPWVAHAGCDLIPGTANTLNATIGAANRPYAAPGERVELMRRPCDGAPLPVTDTGFSLR
jgi:hypothetical protein